MGAVNGVVRVSGTRCRRRDSSAPLAGHLRQRHRL